MSELVGYGIGAVFFSATAYAAIRYRAHLDQATLAGRSALRSRLPAKLQWLVPRCYTSSRRIAVEGWFGIVLFVALAAMMWASFIAGLVCDLRGLP